MTGVVSQKTPLAVGKSSTQGGLQNQINVQEAKEFRVVIQLNVSDEIRNVLRPGTSATAVITTKVKPNVIAVPLQAIVPKPATPAPSPTLAGSVPQPTTEKPQDIKGVYILQNNKVKFVEVTTGITGEADIEILGGLQEGMEVITGPSRVLKTLKDDMKVKRQTRKPDDAASTEASEE